MWARRKAAQQMKARNAQAETDVRKTLKDCQITSVITSNPIFTQNAPLSPSINPISARFWNI
jgi:hypothetical protein